MSVKNKKMKAETGKYRVQLNPVGMEIEKTPVIYRKKFSKEYKECREDDFSETRIIFSFIFLQIYFECFFHQKLRKLVKLEFKDSNPDIWEKWMNRIDGKKAIENKYIQDKGRKGRRKGKLTEFIDFFKIQNKKEVLELERIVENKLQDVTNIRDAIVHGHKIAKGKDFEGEEYKTEAKEYLTEQSLKEAVNKVNEGGKAWNDILDELSPLFTCFNVERIDNFKFKKLKKQLI